MESKNYLLNKFLDRTEFSSYEDFIKNYKLNIPENFNFAYDVIDEWAKFDENKPALLWTDDTDEERLLTFKELSVLSNKTANAFRSLGIKKGDVVMLILKQRIEVWTSILALHKLGAVVIPATFQLTEKDIIYRCDLAGVKLICAIDEDDVLKHITNSKDDCKTLQNVCIVGNNIPEGFVDFRKLIDASSPELTRVYNKNEDPMLLYFSSGTTGMPKMILHDFTYPLGHITTAAFWHKVQDGKRHLTASDSGWAKFAWGKIYGQWICGAVIVAYDNEKFVPENFLKKIEKLKLTTFCAPPTIYRFLIKEDLTKYDLSTIEDCTTAGEPLNPEVFNKFYEATGIKIREGFGQTESTVLFANFEWFDIKLGSMGKPSPLYNIDLIDDDGNPCEDGMVGSIVIKNTDKIHPTGLFKCYLNDEESMNSSWVNGVYNTKDTAWRDADGYFWFEGRNDDVIKCSGYRIGPFEVESALHTHPSVLECAVTATPDPLRGQVVKATIVLAKGYSASDELKKELQNHVKKITAPYKYPRVIEFVDALPKTTSGKISRSQIRKNG